MRGKLVLSHTGGTSPLGISVYETCPRKVQLKMDGWKLKQDPHYFNLGRHFHKMVELHIKDQIDTTPIEYMQKLVPNEIVGGKSKNTSHELLTAMFNRFQMLSLNVVCSEKKLLHQLKNPLTGEIEIPDVFITGSVDMIEKLKISSRIEPDGNIVYEESFGGEEHEVVTDIKTSASIKDSFIDHIGQVSRYAYLQYLETGVLPKYGSIITVQKVVSPRTTTGIARRIFKIYPQDIVESYQQALKTAKAIRNDEWDKNINSCAGKYGPCSYVPLCFSYRNGANAKAIIENTLIKGDHLWDKNDFSEYEDEENNILEFA